MYGDGYRNVDMYLSFYLCIYIYQSIFIYIYIYIYINTYVFIYTCESRDGRGECGEALGGGGGAEARGRAPGRIAHRNRGDAFAYLIQGQIDFNSYLFTVIN